MIFFSLFSFIWQFSSSDLINWIWPWIYNCQRRNIQSKMSDYKWEYTSEWMNGFIWQSCVNLIINSMLLENSFKRSLYKQILSSSEIQWQWGSASTKWRITQKLHYLSILDWMRKWMLNFFIAFLSELVILNKDQLSEQLSGWII